MTLGKVAGVSDPARIQRALLRRWRGLYASALEITSPAPPLPDPVEPQRRVLFVCYGNICRSAIAEGILRTKLSEVGAFGRVAVGSAGTSDAPPGRRADGRARAIVRRHGGNIGDLRPRTFIESDFDNWDLILVMDQAVRDEVLRRTHSSQEAEKVRLLLDYTGGGEVPDPIHGTRAEFERVFELIERACNALLIEILAAGVLASNHRNDLQ